MVNVPNTHNSPDYYRNKSDQELQKDLQQMTQQGKFAEADLIMQELKLRSGVQTKVNIVADFDKKYEAFEQSLQGLSDDEKNQKYKEFFENDLKTYHSKVQSDHLPQSDAREAEIKRLQAMLGENAMELPTFREYISPKNRSFSKLNKKIQAFKQDTANYPKNFLIYAMGMTHSDFLGIGKKLKRNQIKFLWRWKSDKIGEMLQILDEKLKDDPNDKNWRKTMKYHLRQELAAAKEAYVQQQRKQVFGNAA